MAKTPFDPYTPDLFENLLALADGQEQVALQEDFFSPPSEGNDHKISQDLAVGASELLQDQADDPSQGFDQSFDWISDFGQKIGGAKKDTWRSYADNIQLATDTDFLAQPLSKVWPTPNYKKMVGEGVDSYMVAFIRAVRESIPNKPKSSYKVRSWAQRSIAARNLCADLLTGKETPESAKSILSGDSKLAPLAHKIALYELLGHEHSLANLDIGLHSYSRYQGVDYRPAKLLWVLSEKRSKSSWPKDLLSADSYQALMNSILDQRETLFPSADGISRDSNASHAKTPPFIIFSERAGHDASKQYFVGKQIGRHYAKLAGPYGEVSTARDYREQNQSTLEERLAQYKEIPELRRILNEERIGRDYRQGVNITPEAFSDAFGFKGVEFGNWVEQARRQDDLNNAFDALMDLAKVTDLPPKALSLNGELSLAFGARGSGGANPAAAHYEPSHLVINLTKNQGAGSLAHEWWHALDHYFSRENGQALGFITEVIPKGATAIERASSEAAIRPEVFKAFSDVVQAIDQSIFARRSGLLDLKRTKDYWSTRIELSARAFESYVVTRLNEEGFSNDYLANIVSQAQWDGSIKAPIGILAHTSSSYPYPTAVELFGATGDGALDARQLSIGKSFHQFFDALETSPELGKVKVFCTRKDEALEASQELGKTVRVGGGLTAGGELFAPGAGLIFGPTVARQAIRSAMEKQCKELNQYMLHQIPFTLETSISSTFPSIDPSYAATIKGATLGDRVYLFTDAASSEFDIQRTIFHELLHYGLRRYLSEGEFITSMTQLYERDRKIKNEANKWIENSPEGREALAKSGRAYAIARGVDEALAQLAENRAAWVMHLRNEEPTLWQALSRNLLNWSADLAQRLGLSKFSAFLRGYPQSEAIHFIDSIFDKIEIDATPAPDPFRDHQYALRTQSVDLNLPLDNLKEDHSMSRIADHNKPPYVDVIPFYLELPTFRQGDGPLWDVALTPSELILAAQTRFGSVREFVVPQKNGGPYQGECFQIDEHFLAQEIGPRQVTVHRLAHMETRSAAVAYQLPIGLDSVFLSIDYHGARAQVYPYDPQKTQFVEVCKTVEKTMHARQVSTRDQARFKSMWRVSCEDVMRARMGWQRARDVVGPRYKTPGILDPVYQNLYGPYAVPSPHRPNTPAADPRPLGAPVNLQTTYFPRGIKPAPIPTQFLDSKDPSLAQPHRDSAQALNPSAINAPKRSR